MSPAAAVPLHEQLDRIEALRDSVPAQEPRSRLQTICESLYGEKVPEAWLDQALAPADPGVSLPAVCPAPVPQSPTRQTLRWWSKQSYERPGSRAAWKDQKERLRTVWSKWDDVSDTGASSLPLEPWARSWAS